MKTVLITGANKGLGYEMSRQLSELGWKVLVVGRRKEETEAAAERLMRNGGIAIPIQMDIGDDESIKEGMEKIDETISHLDVLINNAAVLEDRGSELIHVDMDMVEKMIQINALGVLKMVRSCIHLIDEGGRIINVSSGAGSFGEGGSLWAPVYGLTKTLVNSITYHLAPELESRGVSINALCPGWVKTEMGGPEAPRSVEEGAETAIWLATKAPASLTGKFLRDKKEIPW